MLVLSCIKRLIGGLLLLGVSGIVSAGAELQLTPEKINLGSAMHSDQVPGQFSIHNSGDAILQVLEVKSSCGCAVTNFKAGMLMPGESMEVNFTVDTTGKMGEIRKSIEVTTDAPIEPQKEILIYLDVKLQEHQQMDRSAIFKGDCAACHAEPALYRVDQELFESVCYMCHGHYGLGGHAQRINDFFYLTQKSDDFFRKAIREGIEGSSMPAFAKEFGGPLDEEQIESLVKLIRWWESGFVFRENEERMK